LFGAVVSRIEFIGVSRHVLSRYNHGCVETFGVTGHVSMIVEISIKNVHQGHIHDYNFFQVEFTLLRNKNLE
jgi:hypothetical protein